MEQTISSASPAALLDTICCYDVLEHLVDPDAVLRGLAAAAAPAAGVHVSVPNARHLSLFYDLLLRGTFGYADSGHRDITHLRWFTRRDIVAAITAAGWRVRNVSHPALKRFRRLDSLTRGRSTEFVVVQFYVGGPRSERTRRGRIAGRPGRRRSARFASARRRLASSYSADERISACSSSGGVP